MSGLRIGIDVGGTFTHGVLLRPPGEVLRRSLTPTTHAAAMGVAEGIRSVLVDLVSGLEPGAVELVAHSTTQATNALLEGDVSEINRIVCVPAGEEFLLRMALRDRSIPTGSGQGVKLHQQFVHAATGNGNPARQLELEPGLPTAVIQPLAGQHGSLEAITRDALGLDPQHTVLAGDITQVLGLKARARTAGINAAMLPRMLETANYTEGVVRELLPGVPLQVVRSDGGAMDIAEMRRQPILSILSGPAAGASAALHRSGLSELIFIEVGGTSTDITLVQAGRVRQRNATVGGNRLLVPALDLRTAALGGGSMLDAAGRTFGPRSAHIAGLPYLFQAAISGIDACGVSSWRDRHGHAYHVISLADGSRAAFTLTDWQIIRAAEAGSGQLNELLTELGLELDERQLGWMQQAAAPLLQQAAQALQASIRALARPVRELMEAHASNPEDLVLLGGGGGAPVLYRDLARELGLPARLIEEHPVISALGAALAVTCVSISRSTAEPRGSDIEELTREVEERLARQGAERVSTEYEYDAQRQVLTVTGRGNRPYEQDSQLLDAAALARLAQESLGAGCSLAWTDGSLHFFSSPQGRRSGQRGLVLASSGRSIWQGRYRRSAAVDPGRLEPVLEQLIAEETAYTDGGALLPGLALLADGRFMPLDQLGSAELVREVLRWEKLPEAAASLFLIR
ncbi:MAG: hydantoinase/oxoprolinase family protein [bacterium]